MKLRAALVLSLAGLAAADEPPAGPALPRPVTLIFKGGDGYEMTGIYYPPPRRSAPALLCFHGLGHNAWVWKDLAQRLQAEGYAVFAANLRGHPEDAARKEKRLNWFLFELPQFQAMARDVEAARACLASQREVNPLQLGLLGEEFGANMALAGGTAQAYRTAAILTPRLDARGISGPEAVAGFGERPCLAAASADDAQGAAALEALAAAAKGRFEALLLPADPSQGDYGAGMLADEGKKDLADRLVAWFKETLPLPEAKP